MIDEKDLKNRFAYHPPKTAERVDQHEQVRSECFMLAVLLNHLLPDGREKAVVMTHLEDAMMWSNAALARQLDE